LPQSRESHHRRLPFRLSSRNIQPHPSPAQTFTLPSFWDIKSSAAERATQAPSPTPELESPFSPDTTHVRLPIPNRPLAVVATVAARTFG